MCVPLIRGLPLFIEKWGQQILGGHKIEGLSWVVGNRNVIPPDGGGHKIIHQTLTKCEHFVHRFSKFSREKPLRTL